MTEPQLTPWFRGDVKPVHVGVYQRDYGDQSINYSRWDGEDWGHGYVTVGAASGCTMISPYRFLPWRGLAQDPSKEKA